MAGHSKWANIKHRKGRADALKGKLFSRLSKEIISAVKQGGADPKANTRLKIVIQKARAANLPNENIERNIKKAASADQADYAEVMYELYGYGGVGIIVEIMTDNKNRASSEMRIATNKKGGAIAMPGSVAFNFDRKGVIQISRKNGVEDDLFLKATDAGAEDFEVGEEAFIVITSPDQLFAVKERLEKEGVEIAEAELQRLPKSTVECSPEDLKANLELIEYLESLEDVDAVYTQLALGL